VFASVLVALAGHIEGRDALVLAAQLADDDAPIVVTHVMGTSASGHPAAALHPVGLRDASGQVYATLGPDPRVRYLPVSGMPFADVVEALARRERPDAIVVGQNMLAGEPGTARLLAQAPCPIVVAPYGHRFVRAFAPTRFTVACGRAGPIDDAVALTSALAERVGADMRLIAAGDDAAAQRRLARVRALAPAATAARVARRSAGALVAQTRADADVLVIAGADEEILRQAACPVLVVPAAPCAADHVAAQSRR
jgi:universal stress protein family protein